MADFRYNPLLRKWVTASGQPVPDTTVIEEMRLHMDAARQMLTALTQQLYAREITMEQWQIAVASLLKDMHLAQASHAVGGAGNLSPADIQNIQDTLKTQFGFLRGFVLAILAGLSLAMAVNRLLMYAGATQQTFWQALANQAGGKSRIIWTLHAAEHCNGCLSLAAGNPYTSDTLPTYPGAGDTECLSNCQCTLEIV